MVCQSSYSFHRLDLHFSLFGSFFNTGFKIFGEKFLTKLLFIFYWGYIKIRLSLYVHSMIKTIFKYFNAYKLTDFITIFSGNYLQERFYKWLSTIHNIILFQFVFERITINISIFSTYILLYMHASYSWVR